MDMLAGGTVLDAVAAAPPRCPSRNQIEQIEHLHPLLFMKLGEIEELVADLSAKERYRQIVHLNQLRTLEPREFEQLVAILFEIDGYQVSLTKESADSGVDLYLQKEGGRGVVQCKKTSGKVGARVIRDLAGTMQHENADWGYVVTTGYFTQPARKWAEGKSIKLVNGYDLLAWKVRVFPDIRGTR